MYTAIAQNVTQTTHAMSLTSNKIKQVYSMQQSYTDLKRYTERDTSQRRKKIFYDQAHDFTES